MNKKVVSLVTMATIMFTSVSPAFAKNFTSKQNVALTHAWNVKFNKALGSNQNFSKVTIKDSNGNIVPVSVTVGSDNQSVTISPKSDYISNTNYTLTVDGIKDNGGKALSDNATMQFTTVNDSTNPNQLSSIIKPELIQGAENRADRVWYACDAGTKDKDGNYISFDSYTLGKVYTYDQARYFTEEASYNPNYDNMKVISGLGWGMKFDQGKLYVIKTNPVRVVGYPYGIPDYSVSKMVRYTNPINLLAEKQIYTLVSNVAKYDDINNKYKLLYNGGYNHYVPDDNGNLVPISKQYNEPTDYFLELASANNNSEGYLDTYGIVEFLENPYTVNGTNYNLKFCIDPVTYPSEIKLILNSVVGSKFGDDLTKELCSKFSNKIYDGEFVVDGVKCCLNDGYTYISY